MEEMVGVPFFHFHFYFVPLPSMKIYIAHVV